MVHCCFGVRHVLAFPTAIHNLRFRHCFRYLSSPPPTTTPNSRLPNHNRNNQGRYRGSQHSKRHSKNFEKVQDQSLALGLRTNNTRSPSTPTRFTNIMGHIHRRIKSTKWTSPNHCATKSPNRPQPKSRKTLQNKIWARTIPCR